MEIKWSKTNQKKERKSKKEIIESLRNQQELIYQLIYSQSENIAFLSQQVKDMKAIIELLNNQQDMIYQLIYSGSENITFLSQQINLLNYEGKQRSDLLNNIIKDNEILLNNIKQIGSDISFARKYLQEVLWGQIWNNTITGSSWLKDQAFSPGGWAVGYQALYLLYRILNDFRPQSILEIGLGQTSKMISQYVCHETKSNHIIIEASKEWGEFFTKNNAISDRTVIIYLDNVIELYKNNSVRVYKDFEEKVSNNVFDLIFIDGPLSSDMKDYARIDVLKIIPHSISKSFIIVIDDYNRIGEKNTVLQIIKKLDSANIKYCTKEYSGIVSTKVICSEDLKYVCSL